MLSLSQLTAPEALALKGLFFDLDDTLLDQGRLSSAAYEALFDLRACGLDLIALTGRPASWAEVVCGMWPVSAAIAENGALAYVREGAHVRKIDAVHQNEREARARALSELVREAHISLPDLVPAEDVRGRLTDYTFDIGEFETATESTIETARILARRRGARTTRSSVHLHFTYDRSDKATGALALLRGRGLDATSARKLYAFIGDSENDAPMFSAFHTTVGVQNLRGRFSIPPRYQTQSSESAGFIELASYLTHLRQT